jgi:hypothetical protein
MLPRGTVSTHTLFCLKSALDARSQWCLLALMNSLVANYLVRLQVTTHVTTSLMARLPVPRPAVASLAFKRLIDLAKRLAKTGTGGNGAEYAELNAIAASLYELTFDDYAHIVETFPLLPKSQRELCVKAFTETQKHGNTETQAKS